MACESGRATRPDLHLGVCGEHGGDPRSIDFFDRAGLDYVSCSPYRVPIARLAAARASLDRKAEELSKAPKPPAGHPGASAGTVPPASMAAAPVKA